MKWAPPSRNSFGSCARASSRWAAVPESPRGRLRVRHVSTDRPVRAVYPLLDLAGEVVHLHRSLRPMQMVRSRHHEARRNASSS